MSFKHWTLHAYHCYATTRGLNQRKMRRQRHGHAMIMTMTMTMTSHNLFFCKYSYRILIDQSHAPLSCYSYLGVLGGHETDPGALSVSYLTTRTHTQIPRPGGLSVYQNINLHSNAITVIIIINSPLHGESGPEGTNGAYGIFLKGVIFGGGVSFLAG